MVSTPASPIQSPITTLWPSPATPLPFCTSPVPISIFLFTLMQMWYVSFWAISCLHWLYWKEWYRTGGNPTLDLLRIQSPQIVVLYQAYLLGPYPAFIRDTNELYVTLFSYRKYINNIILIGLHSNLQNFRFHVKCSVFCVFNISWLDMQNQDRNLFIK